MYPTMTDVAREAGVGVATVDRVINKRAKVRPETAQQVLEAAERLGFRRAGLIRHRIDERTDGYKLGFLLQKRSVQFYRDLGDALHTAATTYSSAPVKALIEHLDELTPRHVAARLQALSTRVDAVAVVAADHPQISQTIDQLAHEGTPVFALLSDLSAQGCAGHIGIDQRKVGRTAAWTISRLSRTPGKVAVMLGSHRYLCQEQAEISFRGYMREYAPDFEVMETLISLEDVHLAHEATLDLLKREPDLVGIFVGGGGIEGVIQALQDSHVPRRLVTVCMDLTQITRQALIEGRIDLVISHPLDWMANRLVEAMIEAARGESTHRSIQSLLPFISYTEANV
jgi:LacI family transcriptional regulator